MSENIQYFGSLLASQRTIFEESSQLFDQLLTYDCDTLKKATSKKGVDEVDEHAKEKFDRIQKMKAEASSSLLEFLETLETINQDNIQELEEQVIKAKENEVRELLQSIPHGLLVPYTLHMRRDEDSKLYADVILPTPFREKDLTNLEILVGELVGEHGSSDPRDYEGLLGYQLVNGETSKENVNIGTQSLTLSKKLKESVLDEYKPLIVMQPMYIIQDFGNLKTMPYVEDSATQEIEEHIDDNGSYELRDYSHELADRIGEVGTKQLLYFNSILTIMNEGRPYEAGREMVLDKSIHERFAQLHKVELRNNITFFTTLKKLKDKGIVLNSQKGHYQTL